MRTANIDDRQAARKREVLEAVVRTYTASGTPVGSGVVAERSREHLSPATIRNLMAELEAEGLLTHPHTSAGRVPTDKGYRQYVDGLLREIRIKPADRLAIDRRMDAMPCVGLEGLMARVTEMLSQISRNVAILFVPSTHHDLLQHIGFVRLSDHRVLVVRVSSAAKVKDHIVRLEEDFTQEELDSMARFLLENFAGKSLVVIRNQLVGRMGEARDGRDRTCRRALHLYHESLRTRPAEEPEVFVEGTAHFIRMPDFNDPQKLSELCHMFEQKERLIRILNQCIDSENCTTTQVRIGAESGVPAMRDCAIITASYAGLNDVVGHVGIVGPTRLPYARMIPVVEYVARRVERILHH